MVFNNRSGVSFDKIETLLPGVEFNNGDLDALRNIKKKWKFKDLEGALRFGLAVLTMADNGKLFHEKENGKTERFEPMDDLIEKI